MVACAKFLGREIETCTRGQSCICEKELVIDIKTQNERFKDLLRQIAYPRRGTEEENMDIFDAALFIQSNFTAEELGDT